MILKPFQTCLYSKNCKYNKPEINNILTCKGTDPNRITSFECIYIDDNGSDITEGTVRNIFDITGKMKYIQEDCNNE